MLLRLPIFLVAAFLSSCATKPPSTPPPKFKSLTAAPKLALPKLKPPPQPKDEYIRTATFIDNYDGDTCRLEIILCKAPEIKLVRKIRLKGVRALEIDPKVGPPDPNAVVEKNALFDLLSKAKVITVKLDNRETRDRIEGIIWADGKNCNEVMLTYPQGGN